MEQKHPAVQNFGRREKVMEIHSPSYSVHESARFGLNVYRGYMERVDIKGLKNLILGNNIDVLILRMPVTSKDSQYQLKSVGFPFLHADTLVYYTLTLATHTIQPLKNELEFEEITEHSASELDSLIPVIFTDYKNHYYSNPFLNKEKILEGYIEWAKSYATSTEHGRISWMVRKKGKTAGFATCSFDPETGICEGILYGVHPDFAGQGIYSDLIRFTQRYFKEKNFRVMKVSTQVQNYSVQKVWIREGFFLEKAFDTYHINALLNSSTVEKRSVEMVFSRDDLRSFADLSGDVNPMHFDDEFARKAGFNGVISHGVLSLGFISKYFGTVFPGNGTLFLENSNMFLKPVYPEKKYVCEFSLPFMDASKGLHYVVVKILDPEHALCLLSYNMLIKK
jgi:ribosomal protein S18 acetylase RimI-like enzyme